MTNREREEVDLYTATLKNGVNPVKFGTRTYGGLTKREHFAGLAMQALISRNAVSDFKKRAEFAVKYAEALIEELEKSK